MDTYRAKSSTIRELRLSRGFSSQKKLCDFIEDINNNKIDTHPRPAAGFTSVAESSLRNAENPNYAKPLRADLLSAIAYALDVTLEDIANTDGPRNPYRGLSHYSFEDADLFFGRRDQVAQGVDIIQGQPLLAIIGDSGAGKSSLALAGVLPELCTLDKGWRRFHMEPGNNPVESLLLAISQTVFGPKAAMSPGEIHARLSEALETREALHWWLMNADDLGPGDKLVLVVDQWEQIYSACKPVRIKPAGSKENREYSEDEVRAAFIGLLTYACMQGSVKLVLTLRADFYGEIIGGPADFRSLFETGKLLLAPMSEQNLREAITSPSGARFSHGLVERLVRDASGEPGYLPLLSFALEQLWERRDVATGMMTATAYDGDVGGLHGAIGRHAEFCVGKLSAEQRQRVKHLLPMLVDLGRTGDGDRELRGRRPLSNFRPADREILGFLAGPECRILRIGRVLDGEPFVEIAHEALLREWPALGAWLSEDKTFHSALARLRMDRERYDESGRNPDFLLPDGKPLDDAENWLHARGADALGDDLAAFIQTSATHHEREARRARRRTRWTVLILAVIGAMAVVAAGFYVVTDQRATSLAKQNRAIGNQAVTAEIALALGSNRYTEALALSLSIWPRSENGGGSISRDDALVQLLSRALVDQREVRRIIGEGWVSFTGSNGTHIYTADTTGVIKEIDVSNGKTNRSFRGFVDEKILSLELSGDGTVIAAMTESGVIKLWKTDDFSEIFAFDDKKYSISRFSMSRDAGRLATNYRLREGQDRSDVTHGADIYDFKEGKYIFNVDRAYGLTLSSQGNLAGYNGSCRKFVYDVKPIELVTEIGTCRAGEALIGMSGDFQICMMSAENGTVEFRPCMLDPSLNAFSRQILARSGRPTFIRSELGDAQEAIFSHANGKVAVRFEGGWVVYDAGSGVELFRPPNETDELGVAYSTDLVKFVGEEHVVVGYEKHLSIFRIAPNERVVGRHYDPIYGLEFSADGRFLVSADTAGRTVLWDLTGQGDPISFEPAGGEISAVASSRDNSTIVTGMLVEGALSPSIRVMDVPSQSVVYEWPGQEKSAYAVAISEQKDLVAVAFDNGELNVYEIGVRAPVQTISLGDSLFAQSIEFNRDGSELTVFDEEYNVSNASLTETPAGPVRKVILSSKRTATHAIISDGSRSVYSSGPGSDPAIADRDSGALLVDFGGYRDHVNILRVSNDETTIATGTESGKINLYKIDLPPGGLVDVACARLPFAPADVKGFLPQDLSKYLAEPICTGSEMLPGASPDR